MILVHYPFIPRYRVPVFNCLNKEMAGSPVFLSAEKSDDDTIQSIKEGWEFNYQTTKLLTFRLFGRNVNFELGVFRHLWKNRSTVKYYIVLSNPNIISSWLYSLTAKILGYKVIFWGHGLLKEESGIKKCFRKLYYKLADHHWLYGNRAVDLMETVGVDRGATTVVYNSLDYKSQMYYREKFTPRRSEIRQSFGIPNDALVLITIGRLLPKLKIDMAIEAIKKISDNGELAYLFIIGGGPELINLKKIAEKYGVLKNVIFVGELYNEKAISQYYCISDASCVMGRVGLAAMHSLAYGVPMITHSTISEHCPEVEAIIEGKTGEFFQKGDVYSFLEAVNSVKNNKSFYFERCVKTIEENYSPEAQVNYMKRSLNDI